MAEEKAAAEKESAGAAGAADSGGGGGGSRLVLILTAVNLVATLAMVGILFVAHKKQSQTASVSDISLEGEGEAEGGAGHGGGGGGDHGGGGHGGGGGDHGGGAGKFGVVVALEQFTVNLATSGTVSPKFVRVNISVQLPSQDTESEVSQKMAQVRNSIIDLFNSKRPADLSTPEGREYLKEEIKNALNSFLVTGKVQGVYFTNFAVSS